METSDLIQVALTVGLFVFSGVGGIVGWFVTRSITTADENLSAIRKDISEARAELTTLLVHRQHDRGEIDDHSRRLNDHSITLAEHHGDIAILKSKVRVP